MHMMEEHRREKERWHRIQAMVEPGPVRGGKQGYLPRAPRYNRV